MDRVSNLPAEIRCHVLSFLTTKEAALTSVLSKKWRNLIAFVPCLDIDDTVFLHPEEGKRDRLEIIQSFKDFMDRVLALQGNSPIKKFSFKCYCLPTVDSVRVDGWISKVLARGVSDLNLKIILQKEGDDSDEDYNDEDYSNGNYRLFPKGFESSTLVNLKIGIGIDIRWQAGSVFLPMLKTLVLDSTRVTKLDVFLHALPALEKLDLVDINWRDYDGKISSASLKSLIMYRSDSFESLSFDTPSLIYFRYTGDVALDYPVVNMENLLDAQITFSLTEEHLQRVREPDFDYGFFGNDLLVSYNNVWKLFRGVRYVQDLYLAPDTLEVLSLCCESMPVFDNLKVLHIESDKDRGWQAMPVLLRNCPHLETLFLEGLTHHVTDKCGDACPCILRADKGLSLASCPVKMLEIQGFRGTMKEIRTIRHFLDYFPSLKDTAVYIEADGPTQFENLETDELITDMFELLNEKYSCNVQLLD